MVSFGREPVAPPTRTSLMAINMYPATGIHFPTTYYAINDFALCSTPPLN